MEKSIQLRMEVQLSIRRTVDGDIVAFSIRELSMNFCRMRSKLIQQHKKNTLYF